MAPGPGMSSAVLRSIVSYGFCSSIMLVINKVTISLIPLPGMVFFVQFTTTFVVIMVAKSVHLLRVDAMKLSKALEFAPYVCAFVLSIYFNGKVLQYSNVETLITFRACSPLCVSVLDWIFLGRELPCRRSLAALLGVLAGAVGYVLCDSEFTMRGASAYGWVSMYLVVIVFEMTYAKHMVSNVKFDNPIWGTVLYNNSLAALPMLGLGFASGELEKAAVLVPSAGGLAMLALCSILGIGMNWSGWSCRNQISAAAYTLLGVSCKLISVLINVLIWDKHASPMGILWLVICLLASTAYRQAPLRGESMVK